MQWDTPEIRRLIAGALREDQSRSDITSGTLIDPTWTAVATIRAKQKGKIAGLPLAERFFRAVIRKVQYRPFIKDGQSVSPGDRLARVTGNAIGILTAERPALNALQHLSGIATFASEQIRRLRGSRTQLFDTRKTLPGWRTLEKYAVRCGGAQNHRMSLGDAMLVKENHLKLARMAGSDWVKRVRNFRRRFPKTMVQIEVQTPRDLDEAIAARPQRLLLDNMPPARLKRTIKILRDKLPNAEIEISGGVRTDQLRRLSRLGVERISMGKLTNSAPAFDCSLDFEILKTRRR